jgi:hypothetical protein
MDEKILFTVDILPPNCSIIAQLADCREGSPVIVLPDDPNARPTHVRFCVSKPDGTESEWSGWFDLEDIPVVLNWESFWSTEGW